MDIDNKVIDICWYSLSDSCHPVSQSYWVSPNTERILQEWMEMAKSDEFRRKLHFSDYYKEKMTNKFNN